VTTPSSATLFTRRVTPDNAQQYSSVFQKYHVGPDSDCPVFDGMYEFCSLYAGSSIDAARKLARGDTDIAINWSGGLHHAKKFEASGFCYVNDIVLAILYLLRYLHHMVSCANLDTTLESCILILIYTTETEYKRHFSQQTECSRYHSINTIRRISSLEREITMKWVQVRGNIIASMSLYETE